MAYRSTCSTLARTKESEPIFVIVARDQLSGAAVRMWALMAREAGVGEDKVQEALEVAKEMDSWPNKKLPD